MADPRLNELKSDMKAYAAKNRWRPDEIRCIDKFIDDLSAKGVNAKAPIHIHSIHVEIIRGFYKERFGG